MDAVVVRAAVAKDRQAVFELSRQLAPAFVIEPDRFAESFSLLLGDEAVYLRVTEVGGNVVAYLLGWAHRAFFANGALAWVQEIVVSAEHRRARYGHGLMSDFEGWARHRNAGIVSLTSKRARDFYRAIGYAESPSTYFKKETW
jgi:GNAT superfamily N-acetyltransferase